MNWLPSLFIFSIKPINPTPSTPKERMESMPAKEIWIVHVVLSMAIATSLSDLASAQESARARFGAWDFRCDAPVGASTEQCVLAQTVTSEDSRNVNLGVIVVKPPELNTAVLRVVAPIGVYLIKGVALKIDQTDIGQVPYFRCSPVRCVSDIPIDNKLLEQMKDGKIATLVIYLEPFSGVRHQVMLEGFKEGYEKLR